MKFLCVSGHIVFAERNMPKLQRDISFSCMIQDISIVESHSESQDISIVEATGVLGIRPYVWGAGAASFPIAHATSSSAFE